MMVLDCVDNVTYLILVSKVIAIVLHPPDDEDDQMAHSESRRNRNMILFHGKGGRRSTSLDIDDKSTCQIRTGPGPSNARFRKAV